MGRATYGGVPAASRAGRVGDVLSECNKSSRDRLSADELSAAGAPTLEEATQLAERLRKSRLSRRAFLLRSGGAFGGLALGVSLKPSLTSLWKPPAFARVSPGLGRASIEWGPGGASPYDDIHFANEYIQGYASATRLDVTTGL